MNTYVCRKCGATEISTVENGTAWGRIEIEADPDGQGLTYDWPHGVNESDLEWTTVGFVCETCYEQTKLLEELVIEADRWANQHPTPAALAAVLGNFPPLPETK